MDRWWRDGQTRQTDRDLKKDASCRYKGKATPKKAPSEQD